MVVQATTTTTTVNHRLKKQKSCDRERDWERERERETFSDSNLTVYVTSIQQIMHLLPLRFVLFMIFYSVVCCDVWSVRFSLIESHMPYTTHTVLMVLQVRCTVTFCLGFDKHTVCGKFERESYAAKPISI